MSVTLTATSASSRLSPVASPTPGHRGDIQGLRAVAVLLVIGDHAGVGWLSGGFVGVDVFFVISGYLITLLLVREAISTSRVRIGEFYARRARRILPAATLVILITLAFAAWQLSLARVQQLREDALWSALFGANLHFSRQGTGYFDQGQEPSPFRHYWSLAVEEQFYLVWPLLLAITVTVLARRRATQATITWVLTVVLAVVVVASLAWCVVRTQAAPGPTYYSSPARAWELALGALIAVQQPRLVGLPGRARIGLGLGGLFVVAVAAIGYDAGSSFPGWRALLPVLGAAALIVAGTGGATWPSRALAEPPLRWLGDISYSLYLWHWPLLVLGPAYSRRLDGPRGTLVLLAATLVAAVLTYHLVENPLRRSRVLRRRRRSLVLWPVAVGAVLLCVVGAEQKSAALLRERMAGPTFDVTSIEGAQGNGASSRKRGTGPALRLSTPPPPPTIVERLADALRVADSGRPIPFPLVNLPNKTTGVFRLSPDCIAYPEETSTRVCPIGLPRSHKTLVVIGDSQAGQWLPAIDRLGRERGLRVLPLVKLGCPPFPVPVADGAGDDYWQCDEFRDWATDYIDAARPRVVIVGSEATSYRLRSTPGLTLEQTWGQGVAELLNHLNDLGARVVVLADTPDLAFDPEDCLTQPGSTLESCVGAPHDGLAVANATTRQVTEQTGTGFLDTVSLLCLRGRCPLVIDRTMTFWDYSHVSPAWSEGLAHDFGRLYGDALDELGAAEDDEEEP